MTETERKLSVDYIVSSGAAGRTLPRSMIGAYFEDKAEAIIVLPRVMESLGVFRRRKLNRAIEARFIPAMVDVTVHEALHHCLAREGWDVEPFNKHPRWLQDALEERTINDLIQ